MTRQTCTKAASLALMKATLPPGKITLVGEKESKMARVVPHIFREEILADRFEWAVIGFNKDAPIDTLEARQAAFKESIEAWKTSHPGTTAREAFQSWTEANLSCAYGIASDRSPKP